MIKNLLLVCILFFSTVISSGCVSETVNKAIGNMLHDPEALETPENPDEPLFNPESKELVTPNKTEEMQDRFE
ncbi:hypothetical protein J7L67_10340, partial [bacterium]|nr:hypothetical protein [bacterium]